VAEFADGGLGMIPIPPPSAAGPSEPEAQALAVLPGPVYATQDDLARLGLTGRALLGVEPDTQDRALNAASRRCDGYLAARYSVPLISWSHDLVECTAAIAAWWVIRARGFDPSLPHDQALRLGFEDAIAYLERIASGQAELAPPIEETPLPPDGAPPTVVVTTQKIVF
jgi:phage gp36-like protein